MPDFDDNSTCWELESTASMPLGHHELRGRSSAMSEYSAELGYVQANSSVERTLKLMELVTVTIVTVFQCSPPQIGNSFQLQDRVR